MTTLFDSGSHRATTAGTITPASADMRITRLAFKNRMTAPERIAIRTAADSDPIIFDFMDLVSDAQFVDLSRTDTQAGVNYLESVAQVLAAGRASEILTNPILDEERP